MGPISMALAVKKPACPAEKTLGYEFLGTIKNPSGQLKLRSKVEVDRLDPKRELPLPGGVCGGWDPAALRGPRVALPTHGFIHGQVTGFFWVSVFEPGKWGK